MSQFCENPSEPLRLQYVDRARVSPHIHISAEFIYVDTGPVTLTLGSLEFSMQTGDYAFIIPNTLHGYTLESSESSLLVVNCHSDVIPQLLKRISGQRPVSPIVKANDIPVHIDIALKALSGEYDANIAYAWANLIFNMLTSKLRFVEIQEGITSNLANKILSYISEHYLENITLEKLAEAMGVSKFHISHLFSSKLGVGFKEYINNLRVENAKSLLNTSDLSIADICSRSGFENQRTFNRVFRENTGMSPRDYRLGQNKTVINFSDTKQVEEKPEPAQTEPPKKVMPKVHRENTSKPAVKEVSDDTNDTSKEKNKMPSWML